MAVQTTARLRPRRRQEERSARTRTRILDAALACLSERGYAATTTTAVATRAGVSRGAQLHHFPTRQELLAAAVEHLFAGLTERYRLAFARRSAAADRLHEALALLWETYLDPRLIAVLELQVAARTDPVLLAKLLPVGVRHAENVHALAREYFAAPGVAADRLEATLDLVLDTLGGLRTRALLNPGDPAIPRTLALLETLARSALVGETPDA